MTYEYMSKYSYILYAPEVIMSIYNAVFIFMVDISTYNGKK